jgi:cyclopropane fatty-acyl-phospholipid synthase-like methyltransferase
MHHCFRLIIFCILLVQHPSYADNGYDADFIDLVELVYGEGYLSQGGPDIMDRMFEGVALDGRSILDLGCGIGGPALYLAENHAATIVGTDPDDIMIQRSQAALGQAALKGTVTFVKMTDPLSLKQFPDNSFDIITSKEALLHVPFESKQDYFKEVYRVLKPGGHLVILDWMHSSPNYSADVKNMMEMDGVTFYLTTPQDYQKTIAHAGFSSVFLADFTALMADATEKDLAVIDEAKSQIIERFDEETYEYARHSWSIQGRAFAGRELLVGLIRARKEAGPA